MQTANTSIAKGSFTVKGTPEPPFSEAHGVSFGRMQFDKTFSGPLTATSVVHFMAARTPEPTSASYVALERITGTLDGKRGSFALTHVGIGDRGTKSLEVLVVADSASDELVGLRGRMQIDIVDGQHFYTFEYEFV